MVEDTPDDLVHELFTQNFWEGHPLGRPILGTRETVEAFTQPALRDYFARRLRRAELRRRRRGQPRARSVARPGRGGLRGVPEPARPTTRRRRRPLPGAADARPRTSSRATLPGHAGRTRRTIADRFTAYVLNTHPRRLDELTAVPEHPREAWPGLLRLQRPAACTATPACSASTPGARTRTSPRSRPRRRRVAWPHGRAGAGRGAAAREGPPQGQPHAEPREHLEPHDPPGAAGPLLRPLLHARRDAGQHRGGHRRRRAARGARSVRDGALAATVLGGGADGGIDAQPLRLRIGRTPTCRRRVHGTRRQR